MWANTQSNIQRHYLIQFCLCVCVCAFLISVVLWVGDLNYRISDLDVDSVKELISRNDFEALRTYDQVGLVFILFD